MGRQQVVTQQPCEVAPSGSTYTTAGSGESIKRLNAAGFDSVTVKTDAYKTVTTKHIEL